MKQRVLLVEPDYGNISYTFMEYHNNASSIIDSVACYILTNTYFNYIVCDATKYTNVVPS